MGLLLPHSQQVPLASDCPLSSSRHSSFLSPPHLWLPSHLLNLKFRLAHARAHTHYHVSFLSPGVRCSPSCRWSAASPTAAPRSGSPEVRGGDGIQGPYDHCPPWAGTTCFSAQLFCIPAYTQQSKSRSLACWAQERTHRSAQSTKRPRFLSFYFQSTTLNTAFTGPLISEGFVY